jgi:hypothetical protein
MPSENRFATSFSSPDPLWDAGAFSNVGWTSPSTSGHGATGGGNFLQSNNSQRRRASIRFSGWSAPNFGSPAKGYVPPGQTLPTLYPFYNPDIGDTFSVVVQSVTLRVSYQFTVNNHPGTNLYTIQYSTNGGGGFNNLVSLVNAQGVTTLDASVSLPTNVDFSQVHLTEFAEAFASSDTERVGALLGSSAPGGVEPRLEVSWEWAITFNPNGRVSQVIVIM